MGEKLDLRYGIPTEADMEKINRVSKTQLTSDQVYILGMRLCDNEVDRDFERFTTQAIEQLAKMYLGKPGMIDRKIVGRIYATEVISEPERFTQAGDVYCWIKAYAYVTRTDAVDELISRLESREPIEVSIGCTVNICRCSICGEDITTCGHVKGNHYLDKLCFGDLKYPLDAYDWAFVVNPKTQKAPATSMKKQIDPVDVKQAILSGQLEVKVNNGNILLGSTKSGEWVKIGQI